MDSGIVIKITRTGNVMTDNNTTEVTTGIGRTITTIRREGKTQITTDNILETITTLTLMRIGIITIISKTEAVITTKIVNIITTNILRITGGIRDQIQIDMLKLLNCDPLTQHTTEIAIQTEADYNVIQK